MEENYHEASGQTPTEFFNSFAIHPELKALYKLMDEQDAPVPCTNYPDAYSIEYGEPDYWETIANAKALCAQCPIRQQCLDYALKNEVWNIWGGLTPTERAQLNGRPRFRPVRSVS